MMPLVRGALAACGAAVLLSGCGSSSSTVVDADAGPTSSTTTPTSASTAPASDLPACHTVWHTGAMLPGNYAGCVLGQDQIRPRPIGCSSGQRIVRYDNHWYAVMGGRIQHAASGLLHDATYLHSVRVCRG